MTEAEEAVAAFAAAVGEWELAEAKAKELEKAEADWKDAMRMCVECKAWVNRYMRADVVALCPRVNLCHLKEGRDR